MLSILFIGLLGLLRIQAEHLGFALNDQISSRIVGGNPISIEEVPYQVSLHIRGRFHCGGSIISNKFILTAAHCVEGTEELLGSFIVKTGTSSLHEGGQDLRVVKIHKHPKYNPQDHWTHDIAILKLHKNIVYNKQMQPVKLPHYRQELPVNASAILTGWGSTGLGFPASEHLQSVAIPLNDPKVCESAYGAYAFKKEVMVCAGDLSGGHNACKGDSGGPLVVDGVQFGIVSWSHGCAVPNFPTIYAHVPNLRDFISSVTEI